MTVLPLVMPVTNPEALIVATPGVLLVQVPPAVASVKFIVLPTQTLVGPPIAAIVGDGLTVTDAVTGAEKQPLATPMIVKFVVCTVVVRFISAPGMLVVPPGPAGSIPSRLVVLSLTQLKAVPPIELLKLIVVIKAPEQIVWVAGKPVITGTALTT